MHCAVQSFTCRFKSCYSVCSFSSFVWNNQFSGDAWIHQHLCAMCAAGMFIQLMGCIIQYMLMVKSCAVRCAFPAELVEKKMLPGTAFACEFTTERTSSCVSSNTNTRSLACLNVYLNPRAQTWRAILCLRLLLVGWLAARATLRPRVNA